MRKAINMAAIVLVGMIMVSCANMPTNPTQITGAYTSDIVYQHLSCDQLAAEYNHLARRENALVQAQEQRIKASNMQAFWLGYGTGDGIEASELADVRGERDAVRRCMELKHCKGLAYLRQAEAEKAEQVYQQQLKEAEAKKKASIDAALKK